MGALLAFGLTHIRGILMIGAVIAAGLMVYGLKHSYDEGKRDEGRDEVRAEIRAECGELAEKPQDCIAKGVDSVKAEYAGKIDAANATIKAQDDALRTANAAVNGLRIDTERRQKAAAQALAEVESRVEFATEMIGKLEREQPKGSTPCERACSLLRSSW